MSDSALIRTLAQMGLIDPSGLVPFGRCRDRSDIEAWLCPRSGVIVLGSSAHAQISYYEQKDLPHDAIALAGEIVHTPLLDDARRRCQLFGELIAGRDWLDVGTGDGAALDVIGPLAASFMAVEPSMRERNAACARGLPVVASLDDLQAASFDVITLFHVFEHLPDPVAELKRLKPHLRPGGRLVIEVPHARDALLTLYDCQAFRDFTLWSEHLVLHTRASLAALMAAAGFGDITVTGVQRYSAANHLYWLRHGKPGGHAHWAALDDETLSAAYAASLQSQDMTDTLVAFATV